MDQPRSASVNGGFSNDVIEDSTKSLEVAFDIPKDSDKQIKLTDGQYYGSLEHSGSLNILKYSDSGSGGTRRPGVTSRDVFESSRL